MVFCILITPKENLVAKCLTLAAVVSSVAVLMGRKGGEDLSTFGDAASTRTKASGESDVETRKDQDEAREDEPVSQPGRDCSPGGSRGRELGLKPWMQPPPKLSALKSPITHVGLGTDLPWELNRFQTHRRETTGGSALALVWAAESGGSEF